jgi:hypothetical protein
MRFYREFAETLTARGVMLPRMAATIDALEPVLGDTEGKTRMHERTHARMHTRGRHTCSEQC